MRKGALWASGERCPGRGNGSCKGCEVGLSFVVFEEHLEGASVAEPSEVKREGG